MQNVHKTQVSMSKVRLSLYNHEESMSSKEKLSTLTLRHKKLASFVSTVRMKFFATTSYMSHVMSTRIQSGHTKCIRFDTHTTLQQLPYKCRTHK